MVSIGIARGDDLAAIAAFYAKVGYSGGVSEGDLTLAASIDGRVAGAVRLCGEGGVTVLRGMHVDPACQRLGIGRALLAHCLPWLDRRVAYCLPYDHLIAFYGRAGFVPASPLALPPFLADRLAAYLSSGQRVLAMRRSAAR